MSFVSKVGKFLWNAQFYAQELSKGLRATQQEQDQMTKTLEEQSNRKACAEKILALHPMYEEFVTEYNKMCEGQLASEHVEQLGGALEAHLKEIVPRVDSVQIGSEGNVLKMLENVRGMREDVQFYACSIDENLLELREIREKSPEKYLRKSFLFQLKLTNQQAFDRSEAFGREWMAFVLKEASSTDILNMTFLFLKAAACAAHPQWQRYRSDLETWLGKHALVWKGEGTLESHPSAVLEMLRGVLYANADDLSMEAYVCYKNCDALSPKMHWKYWQARVRLSLLHLGRAKRMLAKLSGEEEREIRKRIALHEQSIYRIATRVVGWMATKIFSALPLSLRNNSVLKGTELSLAIVTGPAKELWIPKWTIESKWPRRKTFVHVFVHFAFHGLSQVPESSSFRFVKQGCAILINVWDLVYDLRSFSNAKHRSVLAPFSFISVTSTLSSLEWQRRALCGRKIPLSLNLLCNSIQNITRTCSSVAFLVTHFEFFSSGVRATIWAIDKKNLIRTHRSLTNIVIKRGHVETIFKRACTQWNVIKKYPSMVTWGVAIGIVLFRLCKDSPRILVASMMEKALHLCVDGSCAEARQLLIQAQDQWVAEKEFIAKLFACIDFLEALEDLQPNEAGRRTVRAHSGMMDGAMNVFAQIYEYSSVGEKLLYYKTIAYIKVQNKETLMQLLSTQNESFIGSILVFFIDLVETRKGYGEKMTLLRWADPIFCGLHKEVVIKYREFLFQQRTSDARERLGITKPAIDEMLDLLEESEELSALSSLFQRHKFFLYFDAKAQVQVTLLLESLDGGVQAEIALAFLIHAEELYAKDKLEQAGALLSKACSLPNFLYTHLLAKYRKILDVRAQYARLQPYEKALDSEYLSALDDVISLVELDPMFSQLFFRLQLVKAHVFADREDFVAIMALVHRSPCKERLSQQIMNRLLGEADHMQPQKAMAYLAKASKALHELQYGNILHAFFDYLAALQFGDCKADSLIEAIQPYSIFAWLVQKMHIEKALFLFRLHKYQEVKSVLEYCSSDTKLYPMLIYCVVDGWMIHGYDLAIREGTPSACHELLQVARDIGIHEEPMVVSYVQFLNHWGKALELGTRSRAYEYALQSLNQCMQTFTSHQFSPPKILVVQGEQISTIIYELQRHSAIQ